MLALKLSSESIEDILITLSSQLHLLKIVKDQKHFIYLAINSRETNLAIARSVLRQYSENL